MPKNPLSPSLVQRQRALLWCLIAYTLLLFVVAVMLPAFPQAAHYHAFADQRTWLRIPYAMDVLTNLPLLLAGVALALRLHRYARTTAQRRPGLALPMWWWLLALAAVGFALTALASSLYHWQPDDMGVLWDRLAMSLIFAAVIGLAVGQIADAMTAATMTLLTLAMAALALLVWIASNNFSPWIVVQAGGMLLLLSIAVIQRQADTWQGVPQLPLLALIGWYSLAKLAEWGDHAVFVFTHGLLSGHSLKHVLAAMAAWPLLQMLYNAQAALSDPSANELLALSGTKVQRK